jgi:hypothetical protein
VLAIDLARQDRHESAMLSASTSAQCAIEVAPPRIAADRRGDGGQVVRVRGTMHRTTHLGGK